MHSPSEGEEGREQIKDEMPRQKEKVKSISRDGSDPEEEATSRGRSRNRQDRGRRSLTEQAKKESSNESRTSRSMENHKKREVRDNDGENERTRKSEH